LINAIREELRNASRTSSLLALLARGPFHLDDPVVQVCQGLRHFDGHRDDIEIRVDAYPLN
jgi:hypothetical protein